MTDKPQHMFKVGDEVFIDRNRFGSKRPFELAKVERVTKTQFVADGLSWKPWSGASANVALQVGGGHLCDKPKAILATPELHKENEFRIATQQSERNLRILSEALLRIKGQDAIDAWEAMPQHIKDMVK